MNVEFLAAFHKDIGKIKDRKVREKIAQLIERIEAASSLADIANVKKLKGFHNAFRIRMGDYRIGIFLENDTVEFARIVHRKDIYLVFP